MKVLVVTNDHSKFKKIKEESSHEIIGCFRIYNFKKIIENDNPDIILSDGKCKELDKYGQSKHCLFDPEKELSGKAVSTPIFPIIGWKIWVKLVNFYSTNIFD
ncbi:MAG: hypothetical protein ACQEP3_02655 [Patescibacteria group bacterium]